MYFTRKSGVRMSWLFLCLVLFAVSVAVLFAVIPRSLAAQTTMEVYQQAGGKAFGRETRLDIFDNDAPGGQKLVSPFTKGSYTFAVFNNSGGDRLPYALDIQATNPDGIPLVFSLQKNGQYIFGESGARDMLPLESIALPERSLDGRQTDLYTLRWVWRTESDETDTALGGGAPHPFTLRITATGSLAESDAPQTGDDRLPLWVWLVALGVSTLLLLLILFRRRKDKDTHADEQTAADDR